MSSTADLVRGVYTSVGSNGIYTEIIYMKRRRKRRRKFVCTHLSHTHYCEFWFWILIYYTRKQRSINAECTRVLFHVHTIMMFGVRAPLETAEVTTRRDAHCSATVERYLIENPRARVHTMHPHVQPIRSIDTII